MNIVYLHQYFKTPEEGGAVRSYYLASKLVEDGHKVDLITSHNSDEYEVKRVNGIRVHYFPVPYNSKYGKFKRMWAFVWFALKALRLATRLNPDLCYATSTPLSIGWIALKLNKRRGTPFVFEVRDLWPEAPKQLGIIKNKVLLKLAKRLEKRIYYRADKIVALSPGIAEGVLEYVEKDKVLMVPNFSNCDLAKELSEEFFDQEEKNKKFKLVYAGALGYVNNIPLLEQIISTVSELKGVELHISGNGKFANEIEQKAQGNVYFHGHLSKRETYKLLTSSDASLTTFLDYPVLETNSPNKFFDGLACGTICLVNNKGWVKELIEENDCGFHFDSSNFKTIIELLRDDRELLASYKKNASHLSWVFNKSSLTKKISQMIKENFSSKSTSSRVYSQT